MRKKYNRVGRGYRAQAQPKGYALIFLKIQCNIDICQTDKIKNIIEYMIDFFNLVE
jgi:hypothetical protein